ncbi:Flagellar biosynthesis protein FliL [Chitinispirillum alkaliphilum]|nr:Flagellar biosynthesis protein FliL [Chitinispirillum alkaliphilum]
MNKKNDAQENAGAEKSAKAPAKGNKPLFFAILAGVLILNSVMAFFLFQVTRPEDPDVKAARALEDSLRVAMEQATEIGAITEAPIEGVVNIAGTDGERFLKASIIFEYDSDRYPQLGAELQRRAPRLRDLFLGHLSKLTLFEVTEPDARDKIRKDLLRLINNSLPPRVGEVRDVLFVEYIIQ